MVYKTVSVKNVIGRIVRNTGKNVASEYVDDMLEWIPEGIKKLETKYSLKPLTATIPIYGHVGALPCGLIDITAIEYKGMRLREGGDVRDLTSLPPSSFTGIDVFETDTTIDKNYTEDFPDNSYTEERRGEDLIKVSQTSTNDYYKLVPDYVHTSFEEGYITIYGTAMPVDKQGYPLIPDNENYKEALYWYVLMKMMEAGYKHHIFDWRHCFDMFENKYARRAINEIKYPSVDRVERTYQAFIRLIPPSHFYEDFRVGSEQIQSVKGI